ncbi:ATP-binding protein [Nocardiopsis quinghaiensis]|uniref:ATP-binding protein n=1 Tax=Nocardiopsis quinghaiensis TaxID=464995 RepID=UPI001238E1AB|nr:ATP-binding protein [Nocardiopsis quinghaiensis]
MSRLLYWEPRLYRGGLADLSTARGDLAEDMSGFAPDLVDTVRLCLHELQANACKYGRANGEVARQLDVSTDHVLTLTVSNDHGSAPGAVPRVPTERTDTEWDRAEGQRGLLLVENLATSWNHYSWPVWSGLGVLVWASFTLDPAAVPGGPRPSVSTD